MTYRDLITCSADTVVESFKATIIKALIQINRNHGVPERVVAQSCAYHLKIEALANKFKERDLLRLVERLNGI